MDVDPPRARWVKSTRSGTNRECVEVASPGHESANSTADRTAETPCSSFRKQGVSSFFGTAVHVTGVLPVVWVRHLRYASSLRLFSRA